MCSTIRTTVRPIPGSREQPLGPPSTRGEIYETADWLHIATLTHHYGVATGTLRAYLNDGEGNWYRRQFSGNADSLNDWRLYGVRWRETLQPWEGGEIVAGADLDYDRGTSRSVPPAPGGGKRLRPNDHAHFFPLSWGESHPDARRRHQNHALGGRTLLRAQRF